MKQAFLIFCFREISLLEANERISLLFHYKKKNVIYFHRVYKLKDSLADFVKKILQIWSIMKYGEKSINHQCRVNLKVFDGILVSRIVFIKNALWEK